ncbi:hypothetical protein [Kriegella aquimaris]|uniref:Uncharacterized protein n=1 Tax=Kriegella aquimaris TaxID=192904 RepID=A0A1G9NE86_9FLAO|nr:hypothetical protein [Kriegella aquimaris]SDL84769.1 hypothetical protein SAMN04488514_103142 [Kriegella aquimaris]
MELQAKKGHLTTMLFQLARKYANYISIFFALAILNISFSCSYYTVKNVASDDEGLSKQVHDFNKLDKYVIIHSGESAYHLSDMVINDDEQIIKGTLQFLSNAHNDQSKREEKKVHRYKKLNSDPLNEIHFYLKKPIDFKHNSTIEIPLSAINNISINDKNTGRAVVNIVLTSIGLFFVILIIYFATKSSCPFVYIKNGHTYDFVGELYPGIITPTMQHDDYLPLPNFTSENGAYKVKVTNQLKEIQYTDQLELMVANHSENLEVLLDVYGDIQTFKSIDRPRKVILEDGTVHLSPALHKDNDYYTFNSSLTSSENSTRSIIFEFEKPKDNEAAKLYLTLKNTVWLDYVFGKFNEQFGYYYNTFQKNQQKIEGQKIKQWLVDQHIPLSIYVKNSGKWELIEKINTVGPLAMRDLAIPLKLEESGSDKLEIKLETGFMFWEVDYVGIDYSVNVPVEIEYIKPYKATDQNGIDVTSLLAVADQNYFEQPRIGDEVEVIFIAKENRNHQKQSVFLKNRGYYNYIRDYKGIPDFDNLKTFKYNSEFTRFSEKRYFDFVNGIDFNAIQ